MKQFQLGVSGYELSQIESGYMDRKLKWYAYTYRGKGILVGENRFYTGLDGVRTYYPTENLMDFGEFSIDMTLQQKLRLFTKIEE